MCPNQEVLPLKTNLFTVAQELESINIYNILEPCYHSPEIRYTFAGNSRLPASFRVLGETDKPLPVRKRMFGRSWPFKAPVKAGRIPTWPELGSSSVPCTVSRILVVFPSSFSQTTYFFSLQDGTGTVTQNYPIYCIGSINYYFKN